MAQPLDLEGVKRLLREQYPNIVYMDTVHEGVSGAMVLQVKYSLKRREGLAFAKISRLELAREELHKHRDVQRKLPLTAASEANGEALNLPNIMNDEPLILTEGYGLVLYEPAHSIPQTARSLTQIITHEQLSPPEIARQIERVLATMRVMWRSVTDAPRSIVELLHQTLIIGDVWVPENHQLPVEAVERAIAKRRAEKLREKLDELDDRALQFDLPSRDTPSLIFQPGGIVLPNPVAYLMDERLWMGARRVVAPLTAVHGDLHGGNIICRLDSADSTPWVIDFARYDAGGLPFFDLAYLELDLLTRTLRFDGPDQWEDWRVLIEFLSQDVLPTGQPRRSATQLPWLLVKPGRECAADLIASVQDKAGFMPDYETCWWLAATVAGTIFARRSRIERPEQRIAMLLYAAHALDRLLKSLDLRMPPHDPQPVWWGESPWYGKPFIGLSAFTAEQSPIFYGREAQTNALIELVRQNRCVVVTGASGSGKSSLVGAGLIPHLVKNAIPGSRHWRLIRLTPDENPFESLRYAVRDLFPGEQGLANRLRQNPAELIALIERELPQPHVQVMLFIDQFEELFTLSDEENRQAFINLLMQLVTSERVRMVLTVRSDFLPVMMEYPELVTLMQGRQYILGAPSEAELRAMIQRPAQRAGVTLEQGLAERVITDANVRTNPGALALMAYTLEQVQERAGESHLTREAYDQIGGVQGAIEQQADDTFNRLGVATRDDALAFVFQSLVSVSLDASGVTKATRQRIPLKHFEDNLAAWDFIEKFTKARLLVKTDHDVEIAHEALLRSWKRLVNWIDAHSEDIQRLQKLSRDADDWDKGGRKYYLQEEQRRPYEAMRNRLNPKLSPVEIAFLRPERDFLIDELQEDKTTHLRRAEIGDRLSGLEDTRRGVGLLANGLPDIAWCPEKAPLPEGRVTVGDVSADVYSFVIARYPVTYAQYKAFLEAEDGAAMATWWRGFGHLQRYNLEDKQARKMDNCPAESVSWFAAVAFCRWLTHKYREVWATSSKRPPSNWVVRLPTEHEWEWAARGGETDLIYPWGKQWEGWRANTREAGLGRLVAVGMYPQGAALCGAQDMAGGVWEWCLNEYDVPGRVAIDDRNERALRGGSWDSVSNLARVFERAHLEPHEAFNNHGFRVVLAPNLDEA